MITTVARWGNGLAVPIPKAIAEGAGVGPGTPVDINIYDGYITMRPILNRWKLSDLIARITPANIHVEFDWGKSTGAETS